MILVLPGRELAEAGDCTSPRLQVLAALFTLWPYTR